MALVINPQWIWVGLSKAEVRAGARGSQCLLLNYTVPKKAHETADAFILRLCIGCERLFLYGVLEIPCTPLIHTRKHLSQTIWWELCSNKYNPYDIIYILFTHRATEEMSAHIDTPFLNRSHVFVDNPRVISLILTNTLFIIYISYI